MEPRTQGSMYNRAGTATQVEFDAGLRQHMLKVYNYMTVGMLLTAVTALAVTQVWPCPRSSTSWFRRHAAWRRS